MTRLLQVTLRATVRECVRNDQVFASDTTSNGMGVCAGLPGLQAPPYYIKLVLVLMVSIDKEAIGGPDQLKRC